MRQLPPRVAPAAAPDAADDLATDDLATDAPVVDPAAPVADAAAPDADAAAPDDSPHADETAETPSDIDVQPETLDFDEAARLDTAHAGNPDDGASEAVVADETPDVSGEHVAGETPDVFGEDVAGETPDVSDEDVVEAVGAGDAGDSEVSAQPNDPSVTTVVERDISVADGVADDRDISVADDAWDDHHSAAAGDVADDHDFAPAGKTGNTVNDLDAATADDAELREAPAALSLAGLVKRFGSTTAVAGLNLEVQQGAFYGIVGPNGAGKTTTLSMITGLLRPDEGTVRVNGVDVWKDPAAAKRSIGVLPDRLRLFDRLTGRQLLHYSGSLRGLDGATVKARTDELADAFGLNDALGRLVSDYSAGMTKKVALAASMIHSPRLLVLDEPFEAVDPVSADTVTEILLKYVGAGGTVVLSSHSMDMIERVCDGVAIIVHGEVLAQGTIDEVRGVSTLEDRFLELAGGHKAVEGMEWLLSSLD